MPARNESQLLAEALARLHDVLTRLTADYEIIVSDSASTDDTIAIARAAADARVHVVQNALPGKGRAITVGMNAARGVYVGFIDADLEIDPAFIAPLFEAVTAGADFAIAVKRLTDSQRAPHRRLATTCYNALMRRLLGTPFTDHQAGLKLFRFDTLRPWLPQIESNGWFWDSEVLFTLHRAGARGVEVPVRTKHRRASTVGFIRVSWELFHCAVRLRWQHRH